MQVATRLSELKNAWFESLKLFWPANLKPLILMTLKNLKSLIATPQVMPTFVVLLFVALIAQMWHIPGLLVMYVCYITALIVSASRSSIEYINSTYFAQQYIDFIPALFVYVSASVLGKILSSSLPQWLLSGALFLPVITITGIEPWLLAALLFLMDSQPTAIAWIKALGRSLLFVVYNYPFCFIAYNLVKISSWGISILAEKYLPLLLFQVFSVYVFFGIVVPVFICFFTTVYIKQVHEQFALYYNS